MYNYISDTLRENRTPNCYLQGNCIAIILLMLIGR